MRRISLHSGQTITQEGSSEMTLDPTHIFTTIAVALSLATAATADFVTYNTHAYTASTAAGDFSVIDLYACFDSPNDVVLNIFDVNGGNSSSRFYQATNQFGFATWAPDQLNSLTPNDDADFAYDSYVTIGEPNGGAENQSALNSNFSPNDAPGPQLPMNADWFNTNPPNNQGLANDSNPFSDGNFYTHLARFTIGLDDAEDGETLDFATIKITFNQGIGTPVTQIVDQSVSQVYAVPAPSALVLLGLSGFAGTARRRK